MAPVTPLMSYLPDPTSEDGKRPVYPCAKQTVRCTLVWPDGRRISGENACFADVKTCPRAGLPTGEGYEMCKGICRQVAHAEMVAAGLAVAFHDSAEGTIAYLQGHTYACDSCLLALTKAGVNAIIFAPPPAAAREG